MIETGSTRLAVNCTVARYAVMREAVVVPTIVIFGFNAASSKII